MQSNFQQFFSVDNDRFGFKFIEPLHWPDKYENDIKGFQCVLFNKQTDTYKFAAKIQPMSKKHGKKRHPCLLEAEIVKFLTEEIVDKKISPHISFYVWSGLVHNRKNAMTYLPFKKFANDTLSFSSILVCEYIGDGSSLKQWSRSGDRNRKCSLIWKHIIFTIIWTLACLQQKMKFMHNDCHYGNVICAKIHKKDIVDVKYKWKFERGGKMFLLKQAKYMAKLIDFEFSSSQLHTNPLCIHDYPKTFDARYDLHFLLSSILELHIPDDLEQFILGIYPNVLMTALYEEEEQEEEEENCSTDEENCSAEEENSSTDEENCSTDEFYSSRKSSCSDWNSDDGDQSSHDWESDHDDGMPFDETGRLRPKTLLDPKYKNLPTPASLLGLTSHKAKVHPYFKELFVTTTTTTTTDKDTTYTFKDAH